jgi:hypothetical protein
VIDSRLVAPFHPNTKTTERAVTPAALVGGHYEVQRNALYASQVNVSLAPAAGFVASPRGYGDCNAAR